MSGNNVFPYKIHWSCSMNTSACKMTIRIVFCTIKFLLPRLLQWKKSGDCHLLIYVGDRSPIRQNMRLLPARYTLSRSDNHIQMAKWLAKLAWSKSDHKLNITAGTQKSYQVTWKLNRLHVENTEKKEISYHKSCHSSYHSEQKCTLNETAIVPSVQLMHNNKPLNPFYFSKSFSMANLKAAVLAHTIPSP